MFGDSNQRENKPVTYEMELMFFVPKNIGDANAAQSLAIDCGGCVDEEVPDI
jgi:hypothetical protein